MRADRLLSILLLMQVKGKITAEELARQLEVSERTIYRDMEALSAAGFPVTAERGVGGGCKLVGGYQIKLTGLKEKELFTLFILQSSSLLKDLGLEETSKAAFLKLLASLPNNQPNTQDIQQRIYIDMTGWKQEERDISKIPMLQAAIMQERKILFTYQRSDQQRNDQDKRAMDPLGLVAKGTVWYLIGSVDGSVLTYRISRIKDVVVTDEQFIRPEEFNLVQYWQKSSKSFMAHIPKFLVSLKIKKEVLEQERSRKRIKIVTESSPDEKGYVFLTADFEIEEDALSYLLGLGTSAEVIEPKVIRDKIIKTAREIVDFYKA